LKRTGAGQQMGTGNKESLHDKQNQFYFLMDRRRGEFKFKNKMYETFQSYVGWLCDRFVYFALCGLFFESVFQVESSLYHPGNRYGSN
jgi:hypothetical protein